MSFPQNGARVFAMRHRKRIARLGRPADQRKALVRGLVTEVLRHGRITTTKASAPSLWPLPAQSCGLRKEHTRAGCHCLLLLHAGGDPEVGIAQRSRGC